jgi:hypothetical protein
MPHPQTDLLLYGIGALYVLIGFLVLVLPFRRWWLAEPIAANRRPDQHTR